MPMRVYTTQTQIHTHTHTHTHRPAADALAFVLSGAFCFKEIKKMEQIDRND